MSETGSGSDVVSMKLRAEKGQSKEGEEGWYLSAFVFSRFLPCPLDILQSKY